MVQANLFPRSPTSQSPDRLYVYRWDRQGRKGQVCKVTARGTMNSCRLEFEDGFVMITSRNALKRLGDPYSEPKSDHLE